MSLIFFVSVLASILIISLCQGSLLPKLKSCAAATAVFASSIGFIPTNSIATDLEAGKVIFDRSCSGCHAGGQNSLPFAKAKTLFKEALSSNGYIDHKSISDLISNGKGAMPSFGPSAPFGKLTESEISDVTDYIMERAEANWASK